MVTASGCHILGWSLRKTGCSYPGNFISSRETGIAPLPWKQLGSKVYRGMMANSSPSPSLPPCSLRSFSAPSENWSG